MTSRIHKELRRMVASWRPKTLSQVKLEAKAFEVIRYYQSLGEYDRQEVLKWFIGKVFRAKVHSAKEKDEWRPRLSRKV